MWAVTIKLADCVFGQVHQFLRCRPVSGLDGHALNDTSEKSGKRNCVGIRAQIACADSEFDARPE